MLMGSDTSNKIRLLEKKLGSLTIPSFLVSVVQEIS